MQRFALIVAGGRGLRMQSSRPKQFMLLHGLPVLMHTIGVFKRADNDIVINLVLPSDHYDTWNDLVTEHGFDIPHRLVAGGEVRFESVKNGLEQCVGDGIVGIHDGVRPLATPAFIRKCYDEAEEHGTAIPVVPITQSMRRVIDRASSPIDRTGIVAVQTPQCFRLTEIRKAYDRPFQENFTDDATVFEAAQGSLHLVSGEETNFKITTQADFELAAAVLRSTSNE